MFSIPSRLVIASWLLLCVGAAPLDPSPDACGPKTQGPDGPQDSCFSSPPTVNSSAPFGVVVSVDGKNHQYDWTTCNSVIDLICGQMFASNFKTDTVSDAFWEHLLPQSTKQAYNQIQAYILMLLFVPNC